MSEQQSKWLTKELAKIFSEGIRGAIPGADLQLEIITMLISVWCPFPAKILNLWCSDGIPGRRLLAEHPFLNEGGLFLNLDQVRSKTNSTSEIFAIIIEHFICIGHRRFPVRSCRTFEGRK